MIEALLADMTPGQAILWTLGIFIVLLLFWRIQTQIQISRLGARAPKVSFRLPYALDFIYKSQIANLSNKDLELWGNAIITAGGKTNVKTAEVDAGISTRAIMTLDHENIKALLTGQFADYGKGEPFHKEWKEFLGNSIFATDGELWSRSRQLIRPMFVRERIVDTEIWAMANEHFTSGCSLFKD